MQGRPHDPFSAHIRPHAAEPLPELEPVPAHVDQFVPPEHEQPRPVGRRKPSRRRKPPGA